MPGRVLVFSLLGFFFSICQPTKAAINVRMTSDTTRGCAPAQIKFSDLSTSTNGSIVYWKWDLGNGGTSFLRNPSRVYPNPGRYTVTLTVSDGIDTATQVFQNYIEVFKPPTAQFGYSLISTCLPLKVQFIDSSLAGDGPINKWEWDFGDLTPKGSTKNAIHDYLLRGTYSVILKVIDINGCQGEIQKKDIIVVDPPEAKFTGTNLFSCSPPLNASFNASGSKGSAPLSYQWFFGDGGTSTAQSPSHVYSAKGAFDVMLVITDKNGCKDTIERKNYVEVGTLKADFNPDIPFCFGTVSKFYNASNAANTYRWNFGGFATSNSKNPVFTFPRAGTHLVTLVANNGQGCADTIVKSVFVDSLIADFEFSKDSICKPELISFRDKSFGSSVKHKYQFTVDGPSLVNLNAKDTSFLFDKNLCNDRFYSVRYEIEGATGCKADRIKSVGPINTPRVSATVNMIDACTPAQVGFSSFNCIKNKPLRFSWHFGTGNPGDTSSLAQPKDTLVIPNRGWYNGFVEVIDSAGCRYIDSIKYRVGEKQDPNCKFSRRTVCFNDTLIFTSTSKDPKKISTYHWEVNGQSRYNDTVHVHQASKLGWNSVKLTVYDGNCANDTLISQAFFVNGPQVDASYVSKCTNPLDYLLKGRIRGSYSSFYWDFGDNSPRDTTNLVVNHLYSGSGQYSVKLWAKNDTADCKDSVEMKLFPVNLSVSLQSKFKGCLGDTVIFSGLASGAAPNAYFWDFGDGTKADSVMVPKKVYDSLGTYQVRLIVMSLDSCRDTAYSTISISRPQAYFNVPTSVCANDSILLVDSSVYQVGVDYREWKWDGFIVSHDSAYKQKFTLRPDIVVPKRNLRQVTIPLYLRVIDSSSCVDDTLVMIKVTEVSGSFLASDSALCIGDTVQFSDTLRQMPGTSSVYHFGDGDSSIARNPQHVYGAPGRYNAYHITSGGGCVDSFKLPIEVERIDSVGFWATLTDTTCYPATTFFNDVSKGYGIKWRIWDFGDGNVPIRSNLRDSLTKTFTGPGLYSVKLIVETTAGCRDSATRQHYIHVKGPYANYSVNPDSICLGNPSTFSLDTANVYTKYLEWDFADGRLDSTGTNVKDLVHTYQNTGQLTTVLVFSDSGRSCTKFKSIPVVIESIEADYSRGPDTIGCMPLKVQFTDKGIGGDRYNWIFGDGGVSSEKDPVYSFENGGTFSTVLVYSNSRNGCVDSVIKVVVVNPTPDLKVSKDTVLCLGDSATLIASGADQYLWSPGDFLRFDIGKVNYSSPPFAQSYVITGVDNKGCIAYDTVVVRIQEQPVAELFSDTSIITGEEFKIFTKPVDKYIYSWSPTEGLSCSDCPRPTAFPREDIRYTLTITDTLGCYSLERSFLVDVEQKFSVDVPDAFTPNGDGENDLIYPNGWGLKEILEFKVFNRWGELVFEASPAQLAWDGYYKGELQNMDTYIYFVRAIGFDGDEHTKEGYISLLR